MKKAMFLVVCLLLVTSASFAQLQIKASDGSTVLFHLTQTGDVGVGTTTPATNALELGANLSLVLEGTADDANKITVSAPATITGVRTATFPNATGEISLLAQSIETGEITDLTITAADLAASSVTQPKIAATYTASGTKYLSYDGTTMIWGTISGTLPSGTLNGQTLRWNGTAWEVSSQLINTSTNVGIGLTNPAQEISVAGTLGIGNTAATGFNVLQTSNAQATTVTYTMPTAAPGSMAFLKSDASGNWSWDTNTYASTSHTHAALTGSANLGSFSYNGGTATAVDLSNTGVTAGTYNLATITVDAKGRISSASTGTAGANYWTLNGTDIYKNNGGEVGIGTTTPSSPLHVVGEARATTISIDGKFFITAL